MASETPSADVAVIRLRGVRQNNLRSVDLDVPLGRLTVVTGVSGSGKSSLAFDTLYAEGQRRYLETFSAYTRQFLDRLARPDADSIEGVPPAVAIDQSGAIKTSRSTVGTLTGINDYLKLLYARCSQGFCASCGTAVKAEDTVAVLRALEEIPATGFPVLVVAPVALGGFESSGIIARALEAQGYQRFLRGRDVVRLRQLEDRDCEGTTLEIVVDRIAGPTVSRRRRADSVEQAFRVGHGRARLVHSSGELSFTKGMRCGRCDEALPDPTPGLFSFNTPHGACEECRGFGRVIEIDWNRVIPDPLRSIRQGAVKPWTSPSRRGRLRKCFAACKRRGVDLDSPWGELAEEHRRYVLEGGDDGWDGVRGFFRSLEAKKYRMHVRVLLARYRGYVLCPSCLGARLKPAALCFRVAGQTLSDFWRLPVRDSLKVVEGVLARDLERPERLVVDEIASRLRYLESVGLGYLTLDRQSRTLSGGEVERVNLTAALGASLVDTLFVLDEPSIGLHARDNERLLEILRQVRDRGNTVVVVEHDPDILQAADNILDLGPGSGVDGGTIVAQGSVDEVRASPRSLTGAFLSGRERMPLPRERHETAADRCLRIRGARQNNLRGVDVDVPTEGLTVVSGVSGSGKSTLIHDVLWRASQRHSGRPIEGEISVDSVDGFELVDEIVLVDQSPIGRTPRGNPVTYTKTFQVIRELFAATAGAEQAGLDASAFSFNVEGGRCEECGGAGAVQVEMQFLSDVTLPCDACGGKRFRDAVLGVRLRGKSIDDVLGMTIREGAEFFEQQRKLAEKLRFLDSLGLGYLALGQPINTLSGGEAQRLKLAGKVMSAKRSGRLLFLLDEPTTGLHLDDVRRLVGVLRTLIDRGHGVVVIEHHLDVLAQADHLIDLGPEGGDGGGRVVARGTPEEVVSEPRSITGRLLGKRLEALRGPGTAGREKPGVGRRRSRRGTRRSARAEGVVRVVGARENNLRNLTVEIPRNRFVVVTGLSGSGKSSLLYDIVFSEGQRRYLDCLSPYARQFVEDLHRPDIDHLEGIPPSVAIEQRTTVGGRKSTVGTVTEVYHFLRLLFTRTGVQRCPECDVDVRPRPVEEIRDEVARLAAKGGVLLAPVIRGKKGFHNRVLADLSRRGCHEARIDGEWVEIPGDEEVRLARHRAHDIDVVVGRFDAGHDAVDDGAPDLCVSRALEIGKGVVIFVAAGGEETLFNRHRSCPSCDSDFEEPDPRNFSFHSRHGACPECKGYGATLDPDPYRLIENWEAGIEARKDGPLRFLDDWPFSRGTRTRFLRAVKGVRSLPKDGRALSEWGKRAVSVLLEGDRDGFGGLLPLVRETLAELDEEDREYFLSDTGRETLCAACDGSRIQSRWGAIRVGGRTLGEMGKMTVRELRAQRAPVDFDPRRRAVVEPIVDEILSRLAFLDDVGLHYLTLGRAANTLSGGEAQRIRLAAQLGSSLRGACYILDEPTIGLHPRDNEKLLGTLRRLRDQGNSVLVIEHDDATIEAADEILDMGPGPGRHGGQVVVQGTIDDVIACDASATGSYFRDRDDRRFALADADFVGEPSIEIRGATLHNLKEIDVRIPFGAVTVVTGVSGAGKSTLVRDVLEESVSRCFRGVRKLRSGVRSVEGLQQLDLLREVDQLPIGRTPRSTPATYVGFWKRIRDIFAALPDAKTRGFDARRFSFNVAGGRCDACSGQGRTRLEMSFLPDMAVDCEVCGGRRFNPETLEVTYRGRTIADILDMSVEDALDFFDAFRELTRPLRALDALGLGYLTLGQPSTTLSGGEAQRVKLAVEIAKTARGKCLYLFDEPTTGLHMQDVSRLVEVLRELSRAGHAVVVIEHNLEVIAGADWVIDLGPEGGDAGGELLYEGSVAGLVDEREESHTGRCLREFVGKSGVTSSG